VIPTAQGCIYATMLVRDTEITATNVKAEKEKTKYPKYLQ
jgi:hypothetical protein